MDPTAPHFQVGTASVQPMTSAGTCDLVIPQEPYSFPTTDYVMTGFQENLVDVGPMYDADCTVKFSKHAVTIYSPTGILIITFWRGTSGRRLLRMSLLTNPEDMHPISSDPSSHKTSLQAFSAYDLPSVEALVRYFRATASFPVRDTYLKSIKAENFASCTGFTYHNSDKFCPITYETLKGHIVQVRQGICSTNPNTHKQTDK